MARQKGSMNISGTIEPKAGGPLDARSVVPTLTDLTTAANFPYAYVGMETYVTAENKKYRLTALPVTSADNWEEIGAGGGGGDSIQKISLTPYGSESLGTICQYVGETDSSYTKGYWYEKRQNSSGIATPVMTSNTTPKGTVIHSTELNSNRPAWGAFRQTGFTDFNHVFVTGVTTKYLGFDFNGVNTYNKAIINKIELTNATGDFYDAVLYTFDVEASDDATNWIKLATDVSANRNYGSVTTVELDNTEAYRYYRVLYKTGNGSNWACVQINMYGAENSWERIDVQPGATYSETPNSGGGITATITA